MQVLKKAFGLLFTAAVIIGFISLFSGRSVYAQDQLKLDKTSVTFGAPNSLDSVRDAKEVSITSGSVTIKDVFSNNENVAWARVAGDPGSWINIFPSGVGSCKITVIGENDEKVVVSVTVNKDWAKAMLKSEAGFHYAYYGHQSITVQAFQGATGTLKVGSDKYTVKKLGESAERTIKLKKMYKLNTKVSFTVKWNGASYTKKGKVISFTQVQRVDSSKKKPKEAVIRCIYLHKGDTVKLKYGGKTYQKKIKKNYDSKEAKLTFTLKKKLKKNSKITVTFYNKFNQKLGSESISLKNWSYDVADLDKINGWD